MKEEFSQRLQKKLIEVEEICAEEGVAFYIAFLPADTNLVPGERIIMMQMSNLDPIGRAVIIDLMAQENEKLLGKPSQPMMPS